MGFRAAASGFGYWACYKYRVWISLGFRAFRVEDAWWFPQMRVSEIGGMYLLGVPVRREYYSVVYIWGP